MFVLAALLSPGTEGSSGMFLNKISRWFLNMRMSPWSLLLRLMGISLKSLALLKLKEPVLAFLTTASKAWMTGDGIAFLPVLVERDVKGSE